MLSKNEEAEIWEAMMARRRRLGLDPDDYPSIRRRMEHDYVAILLVIKWVLAKMPSRLNGTDQIKSSGRRHVAAYLLLILLVTLGIATTTLAWKTYQETLLTNNRLHIRRSQAEYLGLALMNNSKVTLQRNGADFVIDYERDLEESVTGSIRIPHKIPEKELKRLDQK